MTIVKRTGLGRAMTWSELDGNWDQLQESTTAAQQSAALAAASQSAAATSESNAAASAAEASSQAEAAGTLRTDLASTDTGKGLSLTVAEDGTTGQQFYNNADKFAGDYEDSIITVTSVNSWIAYNGERWYVKPGTTVPFTTTGLNATSWEADSSNFVGSLHGLTSTKVPLDQGGTLQDAIQYITPEMFSSSVTDGDWAPALVLADAKAKELSLPLYGFDKEYAISSQVDFTANTILGLKLRPTSNYSGGGATFTIDPTSGELHLQADIQNFKSFGAKILKGTYTGTPNLTLGNSKFSNNGSILRTTCANAVNTATDYTIAVTSSSGFSVGDVIWIGDSQCTILSISDNTITLVNDGTKPTLLSGGPGTGSYSAGQYFTKDANGNNGLTIGSGGTEVSWNISAPDGLDVSGNGWFGLFQYVKAKSGYVYLTGKVTAIGNGYCGLGLSYTQGGTVSGFVCSQNGNNGLDIYETTGEMKVHSGTASDNGVDGVFICGNATGPKVTNVTALNNKRIGILAYGRTVAPTGYNVVGCTLTGNGLNSICYTGVRSGLITGNTVGGSSDYSVKVEGKNSLLNPSGVSISDNIFDSVSTSGDIFANVGGYTSGGDSGAIFVIHNKYNGRTPAHKISNFNRSTSVFNPNGTLTFTSSYSAAVGAAVNVTLSFISPDTGLPDVSAGLIDMQFCTTSSLLAADTVTSATRNAGIEIYNGAVTNGKILASAAYGTLTYSFVSSTAKTTYLMVKTQSGNAMIQIQWE